MPRINLCLVLSGGVSLGSYIGGAFYELIYALSHNRRSNADVRFAVLTGASAGSMTAAMVARALLYNRVPASDLHEAWVERIGAQQLLRREKAAPGRPRLGLLAETHLRQLAAEMLPEPATAPAASPLVDDRLLMGFTLANLDGIPYAIDFANQDGTQDGFTSMLFADRIVFDLPVGQVPAGGLPTWNTIRTAALASGAFPFAFEPKFVRRVLDDYRESVLGRRSDAPADTLMLYSDGGAFDNEPLGFARDLAELHGELTASADDVAYRYIFVDPNRPPRDPFPFRASENEYQNTFFGFAGDWTAMIFGQSRFQDWIRARKVNKRLDWFADFVDLCASMADVFAAHRDDIHARAGAMAQFKLDRMTDLRAQHYGHRAEAYLAENRRRIEAEPRYDALRALAEEERNVLVDLVFVLENVSALRNKVALRPYLVTPQPGELAGDFIRSFGGFLDVRLREHDWRIGRRTMRELLTQHADWSDWVAYEPEAPKPGAEGLDAGDPYRWHEDYSDVGLGDLDEARALLGHFVKDTVDDLMKDAGVSWIARRLLSGVVTKKVIQQLQK